MSLRRRERTMGVAVLVLGAFSCAALAACSSSDENGGTSAASSSGQGSALDAAPPPSPTCSSGGPRYLAFLRTGTCHDVVSERAAGTWVAHPLFPAAPPAMRDVACTFEWSGTNAGAAPPEDVDVDVLASSLDIDHLARSVDRSLRCEATILSPTAVTEKPAEDAAGGSAPTGVTGCDVCARVFGTTLFAILPPDELDLHTVTITTTDNRYIAFELALPPGTQAFTVELPPNAKGGYNQGRAPLFRPGP